MWQQRKRLGLALSGGVARGLAHVGVIQALEAEGIHADFVSGVSAGALVGACYAGGLSVDGLARMAHEFNWVRIATPVLPRLRRQGPAQLGLVNFSKIELFLARAIGDVTFDELPRPLAIGATDLLTGERVVITSGRVALAVRASASVPGIVEPARWRGRLLCDGFASSNILIQVLRDMGADVVLAVNIMPRGRAVPSNPFWVGNAALSGLVMQGGDSWAHADVVIEPDLAEARYVLPKLSDMLTRGQQATGSAIAHLKALLS